MDEKKRQMLWNLEGLHTVETVMQELNLSKQSSINLLSKLKKEKHCTVSGGGKQKRIYKITIRKQLPREKGMFDIINKYSPNMKLNPLYDHQVHGNYSVEEALVNAVQSRNFRIILASIQLFAHINNWSKLYKIAKNNNCWQQIGALYDVSRLFFKTKKMPSKYHKSEPKAWIYLVDFNKINFPEISKKWKVALPFNEKDVVSKI